MEESAPAVPVEGIAMKAPAAASAKARLPATSQASRFEELACRASSAQASLRVCVAVRARAIFLWVSACSRALP